MHFRPDPGAHVRAVDRSDHAGRSSLGTLDALGLSLPQVFDEAAGVRPVSKTVQGTFDVVGRPGERLKDALRPGDVLLRKIDHTRAHAALVRTGALQSRGAFSSEEVVEQRGEGLFAVVDEGGAAVGRMVTCREGFVPSDQVVLRAR